ncbi:MAG TPA: hypothetical protein VMH39_07780 [Gemmatimonadaceae bacterium]|nr:hypothetical protein [Gemmatimonadaceae bacterium]
MTRSIVLALLMACTAGAQQAPVTRLQPPNGRLTEVFRAVSANQTLDAPRDLRELKDGRILLVDGLRLLIGDPLTGASSVIPDLRTGALWPLAADSSVIITRAGWYFLDGVHLIGMLPASNPVVGFAAGGGVGVDGADDLGFVLMHVAPKRVGDSAAVVRVNRMTGDQEVVAKLWPGEPTQPDVFRPVCRTYERAVVASDGWVAVVRVNPYRVDWRSPDGRWSLGSPIPTPVVRMTDAEKQVYLDWRAGERPPQPRDTVLAWPETVCPWVSGYRPMPTPDGKLVVYRVPTTDAPAVRYDVINRQGHVERQVVMPPSDAILGFGKKSVYVVTTSGGSQTIQRHPWP